MTLADRWASPMANWFSGSGLAVSGLAVSGGGLVWYAVLMRRFLTAASYGPICGHSTLLGPHCLACYAALGMVGLGLGLLFAAVQWAR